MPPNQSQVLEEYLTPEIIAQRLKVDYSTVMRWIQRGKIQSRCKLGRRILRIPASEVNRFLQEHSLE